MDKEIMWNIINSLLAGGLVFLGGCSTGEITMETFVFALVAGGSAAMVQFRDYWMTTKPTKRNKKAMLFKFL